VKKVAILQSNYIPWKGYFDLIASVDEFIVYDDVQYTHHDWRNRNRVKTPQGLQWMSIPVLTSGRFQQSIRDVEIGKPSWAASHWRTLEMSYRRAPHFDEIAAWLAPLYLENTMSHLSPLNRGFIEAVCAYLDINTVISNSWDYVLTDGKSERLVSLCQQAGATEYVSGPAAKSYLDEALFAEQGIATSWFDYGGYPTYPQLWGDFVHEVTVLDLLFNCGRDASAQMKFVGR
jgi:hypothetical protein